jgi:hypothetical protein
MQGGVVVITPNRDARTIQLPRLIALGADLSCIEILSYVYDPETASHSSGYRPFSLPEDLQRLFEAAERVNARFIILDDFSWTLSHKKRWTQVRLLQFLNDLNQQLIAHNIACLLIRDYLTKGERARQSICERSEHFETIAASHLLTTRDPILRDHLFLSHVTSCQAARTLILQIQRLPAHPHYSHIVVLGFHCIQAKDFMESSPDALLRLLLSQHLLSIITDAPGPIHIFTIYEQLKPLLTEKLQRSLNDLLCMGQIKCPARGWYSSAITILDLAAATTSLPQSASSLDAPATATSTQTTLKTTEAYEEADEDM